jgi:hypothetical protein
MSKTTKLLWAILSVACLALSANVYAASGPGGGGGGGGGTVVKIKAVGVCVKPSPTGPLPTTDVITGSELRLRNGVWQYINTVEGPLSVGPGWTSVSTLNGVAGAVQNINSATPLWTTGFNLPSTPGLYVVSTVNKLTVGGVLKYTCTNNNQVTF